MTPPAAMPGGDKFAEAILAQTEAILADKLFAKSPQLRRFLRFAVERTLTGDGMRLKEYTIAVEALGRPESFDARLDSIVRVEARRLREKLETYYETKGMTDRVVIRLEPGKYIPLFLDRIGGSTDTAITLRIGLLQSSEEPLDSNIASAIESLGYANRPVALDRIASDAVNFDILIASVSSQELSRAIVSQTRGLLRGCPGLVFVLSPESMREVIAELFSTNAEWIVQP
ncbi:MAG: hypothetical protein ACRD5Z_03200, partial [Bryobacteraceae bacterium]